MRRFLVWFVTRAGTAVLRRLARKEGIKRNPHATHFEHFIEPESTINPLLVMTALNDARTLRESNPEHSQALLNACLYSVQAEGIREPLTTMYLGAISEGTPPDVAVHMLMANMLHLGMLVERRLQKANTEPSVPAAGDIQI